MRFLIRFLRCFELGSYAVIELILVEIINLYVSNTAIHLDHDKAFLVQSMPEQSRILHFVLGQPTHMKLASRLNYASFSPHLSQGKTLLSSVHCVAVVLRITFAFVKAVRLVKLADDSVERLAQVRGSDHPHVSLDLLSCLIARQESLAQSNE